MRGTTTLFALALAACARTPRAAAPAPSVRFQPPVPLPEVVVDSEPIVRRAATITLSGVVRDTNGPISDARVAICSQVDACRRIAAASTRGEEPLAEELARAREVITATPSLDGSWTVEIPEPKSMLALVAVARGRAYAFASAIQSHDDMDFVLEKESSLRISLGCGAPPCKDALVVVRSDDDPPVAVQMPLAAGGKLTLHGMRGGRWRVDGYSGSEASERRAKGVVDLASGATSDASVALRPTGTGLSISGRLRPIGPDKQLRGIVVRAECGSGGDIIVRTASAAPDGAFSIADVGRGPCALSISEDGSRRSRFVRVPCTGPPRPTGVAPGARAVDFAFCREWRPVDVCIWPDP